MTDEPFVGPALLVPSALFNMEQLLLDLNGPHSAALLGVSWHMAEFTPDTPAATEFDLPMRWEDYGDLLAAHSGIGLEYHACDEAGEAFDRLALGQPVILAVDSYYLPYRPAYRRINAARSLIATGIDRATDTVEILDTWMPTYRGPLALEVLDQARASLVPHDVRREPLYAGEPLRRRWWALALRSAPTIAGPGGVEQVMSALVAQATAGVVRTPTAYALERSRVCVAAVLAESSPQALTARRSAALWLRGEIGLRAYLLNFLQLAAALLEDDLMTAEIRIWAPHLADLARARDILIKSLVFQRSEYAALVDEALDHAAKRERRFVTFVAELCGQRPVDSLDAEAMTT